MSVAFTRPSSSLYLLVLGLSFGMGTHPQFLLRRDINAAAAAAAKSLQSCPTLCDPKDVSPPGSAVPGILQARTLEWVAISFCNAWKWKVKVKSLSHVRLFANPWTAAYQAPPSMGFSRQKYWSGVPLSSPDINADSPQSTALYHNRQAALDLWGYISASLNKKLFPTSCKFSEKVIIYEHWKASVVFSY